MYPYPTLTYYNLLETARPRMLGVYVSFLRLFLFLKNIFLVSSSHIMIIKIETQDETCEEDEIIRGVLMKIENLTAIPANYSEDLQLLRYEEGQFYATQYVCFFVYWFRADVGLIFYFILYI